MRVACIQLCSGTDRAANLETAARLLGKAAGEGAELALLPENFAFMGGSDAEKRNIAEDENGSATLRFLSEQAATRRMAIVGGTLLLNSPDGRRNGNKQGRMRNTCPVFDNTGKLLAAYDKIHLFDMDYEGESCCESAMIEAGSRPVATPIGAFRAGLSICYDLRFPELYRAYAADRCDLLCNVAAFTAVTGRAHWRTLLRARAIENQSYVLAAAQWGEHPDGRRTWGHSMIIDPWGETLAELADGEGMIIADLSKARLQQLRSALPALQHRRL